MLSQDKMMTNVVVLVIYKCLKSTSTFELLTSFATAHYSLDLI